MAIQIVSSQIKTDQKIYLCEIENRSSPGVLISKCLQIKEAQNSIKLVICYQLNFSYINGTSLNWQSLFCHQMQFNSLFFSGLELELEYAYYFKNKLLNFIYKTVHFHKRNTRFDVQTLQETLKRDALKINHRIRMLGFYFSLPNLKTVTNYSQLYKLKVLKQKYLQFQRDLSITLNKVRKIKLIDTCKPTMKIQIETNSKCQENSNEIVSKTQQMLSVLVKNITETVKRKKGKNLFVISQIEEEDFICETIGGVSAVQKRKINYIKYSSQNDPMRTWQRSDGCLLAKKILKEQKNNNGNSKKRFERELDIVKKLVESSQERKFYLLDYYYIPQMKELYYVEWHDYSLVNYLQKYRSQLSAQELLLICFQIVLIVIDLHESGIVHRDLKPSNFMVDTENGCRFPILKLIDFSDSMVIDEKSRNEVASGIYKVYSTPAYCPLETSSFSEYYEKLGLINPKIDNWSLGIILFEVLNGYLPVTYSTCTTKDIHALWKYEFMNILRHRKQENMGTIHNIVDIVSYELIKMEQSSRLDLSIALYAITLAHSYILTIQNSFTKLIAQNCRYK